MYTYMLCKESYRAVWKHASCCLLLLPYQTSVAAAAAQGSVSSLLSFLSHQTGQAAQKRAALRGDGWASRTEGEGAKTKQAYRSSITNYKRDR